jgi:F420-dependent oxidoreductase-like protein
MRLGLSGVAFGREKIVEHARRAEQAGFSSIWYPGGAGGDALTAILLAGLHTERIELGTAVLATYPVHPVFLAARVAAIIEAIGADRLTLGVGPSHKPAIEDMYGLKYDRPLQHTDEFLTALFAQLGGGAIDLDGELLHIHVPKVPVATHPVQVLLGALGPRMLELAGRRAAGAVTWMANAIAIERHVEPIISNAASSAGRDAPRIVVGIPVVVHDDVEEARAAAARRFAIYGSLPNYQRILAKGSATTPEEVVVVGNEASVAAQLEAIFNAGATDIWVDVFAVGEDRTSSRARTMRLLSELTVQ